MKRSGSSEAFAQASRFLVVHAVVLAFVTLAAKAALRMVIRDRRLADAGDVPPPEGRYRRPPGGAGRARWL